MLKKKFPAPTLWIRPKIGHGVSLMISPVELAVRIMNAGRSDEAILSLATDLVDEITAAVKWAVQS